MVGSSSIGRTAGFGPADEGSTPSSRTRYSSNSLPAPCRKCGGPSWLTDSEGAVHPCCVLEWTQASGCLACRTSDKLNSEHRRRGLTNKLKASSVSITEKGDAQLRDGDE